MTTTNTQPAPVEAMRKVLTERDANGVTLPEGLSSFEIHEREQGRICNANLLRRAREALSASLAEKSPGREADQRICRICDGGPGNDGPCLCGFRVYERASLSAPGSAAGGDAAAPTISVDVQRMETSRGPDFFVRIQCGDRSVTPHVFRERYKAEYEAAHFAWIFGLRSDEPDVLSYGEHSYPNAASPASPEAAGQGGA